MESSILDAIIGATIVDFVVRAGFGAAGGLLTVFGFWGLRRRVKALEAKTDQPVIHQTFNYPAATTPADVAAQLRGEVEGKTVRNLRETMRRFRQEPLMGGHTYARLPIGTYIVSMADGSYRLGLPAPVKHTVSIDREGNVHDR